MATTTTPADGSGKKVRKPYTITKSRESWTQEEHDKFLEALQLFDRDGKKIEDFVGSKTVIQVLLLMRNLTVNLSSPDFEPIRNFLSSYDINTKTVEVTADIDAKKLINDLACQTA